MMNILHFSQSVKWSSWFICSLLLHGLIFLAFIWRFRSSARYVSCTGDHAAMGRNYRGSFFSTFASGGNRSTGVRSDRRKATN